MLEAAPADLDAAEGASSSRARPTGAVEFTAVVNQIYRHTFGQHAENVEPGLEATRYFRMGNIYHQPETQGRFSNYPAWPFGAAAAVVEVDPETGVVRILDYTLVEDAGTLINPLLVDANLHGAITQGIGSAMYETIEYDEYGQLQTATLMDYTIPTAIEVPNFTIEHQETPSPFTPLGQKGAGESGVGSALGALMQRDRGRLPGARPAHHAAAAHAPSRLERDPRGPACGGGRGGARRGRPMITPGDRVLRAAHARGGASACSRSMATRPSSWAAA